MRALGAQLVSDELIVFPVRHHSPACALQLLRLFSTCRPSAVLVEGPRAFTPLIPLLAHAEAQAPVAIYTYAVHKPDKARDAGSVEGAESENSAPEESRRAAYYPFCDYSPELVALREATRLGVPARFIDLDFAEQCVLEPDADDEEATSLLDERHYRRSAYLRRLAERLGCRDHEELWEHLFENSAPTLSLQAHVEQVATYCHLARRDNSDEELAADGTLQREAEMAWHVQEALAQRQAGEGLVLAVMGGFHAVALPALLAKPVKRPTVRKGTISDESSALIRYSFDRLDRLNGYSAGMTSPGWHQRLWEGLLKQEKAGQCNVARLRKESALTVLFDIALELRDKHQLALPMPSLGAAFEQVLRLATLRGRPAPLRDDVMDGVVSCFIKGDADADGALVRAVAQRTLSGRALGKVPAGAGTPPLVKDFEFRVRKQRLKIDGGEQRRLVLDLYRRPEHRVTSRLLHGLALLGVPFAVRTVGPDFVNGQGLDRLQEHWEYIYTPMTEAALVEASLYGVTVPLAVANRFVARLDRLQAEGQGRDAKAAAAALVHGCVLGLHDHLARALALLRIAIGEDASFASVTSAAMSVGLLWESREPLEARDLDELPAVLRAAYERTVFLGRDLQGAGGEVNDGGGILQALAQLRELLRSPAGQALDAGLYWQMVDGLYREHDAALIRGACAGLLYAAGLLAAPDLGTALTGHLDGLTQPREAVSFLRGLLHSARETAWQQAEVLQVLDHLLAQWDESAFVSSLPELRLAFAEMTPRETDRVAEAVAHLHGEENLGGLVRHDLSEAQLQNNLALSRAVRDVLVADGLAWGSA
jgi:hypothetical protein